MKPRFKITQEHRNVITVRHQVRAGFEQWFLLSADRHHDNVDTDQALERKHLEQAKERGAGVIDIGDLFCAMQGKFDKRSSKSKLRDEHKTGEYLDALVSTAAKFYGPYAQNIVQISPGNHETAIQKNHETNLTERLVERLNAQYKSDVRLGGFAGWVRFHFVCYGARCQSFNLNYHHGYGGGGPVTRGVIQTNRMAVYLPDAHFVATGHTHDQYVVPIPRARLSSLGVPYSDEQVHIKIPTYKDEYGDGNGGWHVEGGRPPKPIGAVWIRFFYDNGRIKAEVTQAK